MKIRKLILRILFGKKIMIYQKFGKYKFEIDPHGFVFEIENKSSDHIQEVNIFKPGLNLEELLPIKINYANINLSMNHFLIAIQTLDILVGEIKFIYNSIEDFNCSEFSLKITRLDGYSTEESFFSDYKYRKIDLIEKSITYYNLRKIFNHLTTVTIFNINPNIKFKIVIYGVKRISKKSLEQYAFLNILRS